MLSIDGRTILLTGAAGGIGTAIARQLAANGANLVLVDIQADPLEALGKELGHSAIAVVADITEDQQVARAVDAAVGRFGGIDVVVANAAIDAIEPIREMAPATFERVVQVNLIGTYRTVHAALPAMEGRNGHILIINSLGSVVAPPFMSAYAASKAGLTGLADSLRLKLRGSGTTVGMLYFGGVDTEHFRTGMSHPLMLRANARIPKSFTKPASTAAAATAVERAIEHRTRRAIFPRSNAPVLWAPRLLQRLMERRITT